MPEPRKVNRSGAVPILIAVLFLVGLLGTYVAGYLLLPARIEWADNGFGYVTGRPPTCSVEVIERVYPQQWMTTAYRPAATLEGRLRGIEVRATWRVPLAPVKRP